MDERRCVEVLREMLQYTMGTGVLVDEEREALDHAIATIERVAEAAYGFGSLDRMPENHSAIIMHIANGAGANQFQGKRVRILHDPESQSGGQ